MKIGDQLFITPKMGINPWITSLDFETLAKQLKEAILCAIDAGVLEFQISTPEKGCSDLTIMEVGLGMDERALKEVFLDLGGSEMNAIARIGLGIMAYAPLCNSIIICTRKGGGDAIEAELNVKDLFEKSMHLEQINAFAVGKILNIYNKEGELKRTFDDFIKITLKNLLPEIKAIFEDDDKNKTLVEDLRKILPLKFPDECELFKHISVDLRNRLIALAGKPFVTVYVNQEKLVKRVYGDETGEEFQVIMELKDERVGQGSITGFIVENKGRIIHWKGVITRYQNAVVEDEGFLGWNKRIACLPRISGEIFLEGLNKNTAISIGGSRFNVNDKDFIGLREKIWEKLDTFTSNSYNRSYIASGLRKAIKKQGRS